MVPRRPYRVLLSAVAVSFLWGPSLDAQFVQQAKLVAAGRAVGNAFLGSAVALSRDGNTALVGGPEDDSPTGAAWVFVRASDGTWSQQQKLISTSVVGEANQGYAVALSADGNTALIGGPADGGGSGAAWIWVRSETLWTEKARLAAPDATVFFGGAVSLSGDGATAAVGGKDDNLSTGAAWVWVRVGTNWEQTKLVATPTSFGALQGSSVGLSADGQTLIVGAPGDSGGQGAVWVFTRSENTWTQGAKLVALDAVGTASQQGSSVFLSEHGDTAVVSGPADAGDTGAAWIWTLSGGAWTKEAKLVGTGATETAEQGATVSLAADGNTAIVGSVLDNASTGAAWIWSRSGSGWTQSLLPEKLFDTGSPGARQGVVALSGDGTTALIGGSGDDANTGAAWAWGTAALRFVQQPVGTPAGQTITPPVTVQLYGGDGLPVTQSGVSVTMSLGFGTGSLSGTVSQPTANGLASFDDLSIDLAGQKQLTAAASGYLSTFSSPFAGTCPSPPTAVASGSATICRGISTPLAGSGGVSCSWTPPTGLDNANSCAPSASPSATTTYTLIVADAAGCSSSSVNAPTVTVTVSGVAPNVVITAPLSALPNATGLVASVPSTGATYTWTVANGSRTSPQGPSITYSAGSGGFVFLSVTATNGPTCSATGTAATAVGAVPADSLTFTHFAGAVGGPAAVDAVGTAARFLTPSGVGTDGAGNLYVGDGRSVRRIVLTTGEVTTLAGVARSPGSLDGTGSAARFTGAWGITADSARNLYVADQASNTIRKITPAGDVTTFAGLAGSPGKTDGLLSKARFFAPTHVALDPTQTFLYVLDTANYTVRRIDLTLGIVSTYAGEAGVFGNSDGAGTSAHFWLPTGMAIDGAGNLYVADSNNMTIRKIAPAGPVGSVQTFAGAVGQPGSTDDPARFTRPLGLAIHGNALYVADSVNGTIRSIDLSTRSVTTFAGFATALGSVDGIGNAARFQKPVGVATDSAGNVYVVDQDNFNIRMITPDRTVTTLAGLAAAFGADNSTGALARFKRPNGIAVDQAGNSYVADTFNHTIRKITSGGSVSLVAGSPGIPGSTNANGSAALFRFPRGVAADSSGNVYVADTDNNTIRKIDPLGNVSKLAGGDAFHPGSDDGTGTAARFSNPWALAVDAAGNVYVADAGNSTIRKITPAGVVSTLAGLAGAPGSRDGAGSLAQFMTPQGVAVDAAGNVYVADAVANRIRKVTPAGFASTLAGPPDFGSPTGIAADVAGNLWVADAGLSVLKRVTPSGVTVVTTVGGTTSDFGSDDGTGSTARFWTPQGIAIDPSGNLLVAEQSLNEIRIGRPALADVATIDSPGGAVGASRQLDTSPKTANSWTWEVIRRPSGSTALLSSTSVRNPIFTPDSADLFVFRLTASDGRKTSITTVSRTATGALLFYPVYPCRLFQTGSPVPAPPFTGLDLGAGETRSIAIPAGGACGIPPTARAIALNATVVAPTAQGYLTFWASGTPRPLTSSVNFTPPWLFFDAEQIPPRFIRSGGTRSGNTIVSTPTGAGAGFEVLNGSAGAAGLIIDVSGYFE